MNWVKVTNSNGAVFNLNLDNVVTFSQEKSTSYPECYCYTDSLYNGLSYIKESLDELLQQLHNRQFSKVVEEIIK